MLGEKIMPNSNLKDKTHEVTPKGLNWHDRPKAMKEDVISAYQKISANPSSQWGLTNGAPEYNLICIEQYKLLKNIILKAPEEKEFFILDLGAGNFEWGRDKVKRINSDPDLPTDIKVNVIGIRGEKSPPNEVYTDGKCKIYEFGNFMAENLTAQLKKVGLQLDNKIDLIVTAYTMRHLVDPVGTFVQAYNLLKPNTGYILSDSIFFMLDSHKDTNTENAARSIQSLLLETKSPFLFIYRGMAESSFILKRTGMNPFQPAMKYTCNRANCSDIRDKACSTLIFSDLHPNRKYSRVKTENEAHPFSPPLEGNVELLNYLTENNVWAPVCYPPMLAYILAEEEKKGSHHTNESNIFFIPGCMELDKKRKREEKKQDGKNTPSLKHRRKRVR